MKKGWRESTLHDILDIQNGYAFSSRDYTTDGHFVVRIGNVQNGYLSTEDPRYVRGISSNGLERFELAVGDMLVSLTGNVGRVALINEDHLPAVLNQRVARLRARHDEVDSRYLLYFLYSEDFRNQLIESGHGAAQQNVSTKEIGGMQFSYPPLEEQQRIVAMLDNAFAAIARAKENAEKNLQNAKELFETELNEVLENGKSNWDRKRIDQLCDVKHGFAFSSTYFRTTGNYVLLTPGNFFEHGGYRDRGEKQKYYEGPIPKGFILSAGDLLVAMTEQAAGLLGSPIIVPEGDRFLHNQRLGLVRPKDGVPWLNRFFYHVFNLKRVRQEIHDSGTGVKVRHTSPTKIGDVEVSYPTTIEEQLKVVARLERIDQHINSLCSINESKVTALDDLKKSFLHYAFSGEL